jgi:hypothetical protein
MPRISGAVEELTSSADGKVLGFILSPCKGHSLQVAAIHLATGQVNRWRYQSIAGSPSLTADGSVLGIVAMRTMRARQDATWTIRTDAPPPFFKLRKVLTSHGRPAVIQPVRRSAVCGDQLVQPTRGLGLPHQHRLDQAGAPPGTGGQRLAWVCSARTRRPAPLVYGFADGLVKVRPGPAATSRCPYRPAIDGASARSPGEPS